MDPDRDDLVADRALGLRDLVLMVREAQVVPSARGCRSDRPGTSWTSRSTSMCQPGNPSPHGLGHFIRRPGPAAFHKAKSAACRLRGSVSRSRCPSRRLSSVFPDSLPVAREGRHVEVHAAGVHDVGVVLLDERLRELDHLGDVLGGLRRDVGSRMPTARASSKTSRVYFSAIARGRAPRPRRPGASCRRPRVTIRRSCVPRR